MGFSNNFPKVFYGKLSQDGETTIINGRFKLHILIRGIMVYCCLVLILAAMLSLFTLPELISNKDYADIGNRLGALVLATVIGIAVFLTIKYFSKIDSSEEEYVIGLLKKKI